MARGSHDLRRPTCDDVDQQFFSKAGDAIFELSEHHRVGQLPPSDRDLRERTVLELSGHEVFRNHTEPETGPRSCDDRLDVLRDELQRQGPWRTSEVMPVPEADDREIRHVVYVREGYEVRKRSIALHV